MADWTWTTAVRISTRATRTESDVRSLSQLHRSVPGGAGTGGNAPSSGMLRQRDASANTHVDIPAAGCPRTDHRHPNDDEIAASSIGNLERSSSLRIFADPADMSGSHELHPPLASCFAALRRIERFRGISDSFPLAHGRLANIQGVEARSSHDRQYPDRRFR